MEQFVPIVSHTHKSGLLVYFRERRVGLWCFWRSNWSFYWSYSHIIVISSDTPTAMDGKESIILGYVTGLAQSVFDSLGTACAQLLDGFIPPFELNLGRYGTQFVVCLLIILIRQEGFRVEPRFRIWIGVRVILGNIHNILFYTAASLVPLGNLVVAHQAAMLISSVFISKVILKHGIPLGQYLLIIVTLIGGFLVGQPDPPFHHLNRITCNGTAEVKQTTVPMAVLCEEGKNSGFQSGMSLMWGYILTVASGITIVASFCTFRTKLRDISPITAAFYYGAGGIIISIGFMIFFDEPVYIMDYTKVLLFAGHCLGITMCSLFLIHASQLLTPVTLSIVTGIMLVFNFILQYCFPGIFLSGNRNVAEVVGAVLIVCCTILSAWWNVILKGVQSEI